MRFNTLPGGHWYFSTAAHCFDAGTYTSMDPQRTKIMQYILFGAVVPPDPNPNAIPGSSDSSDTSSDHNSSTGSGTNAGSSSFPGSPTIAVDANLGSGSSWRHFSWQIPTMMLGNSIVFTLVAIAIAAFDEARMAPG